MDGTSSSDRQCSSCVNGLTYQDSDKHVATACKRVSAVCPAGQYQTLPASLSNDRRCSSCGAGKFSERSDSSSCDSWTSCGVGEYQSLRPTLSSDREVREPGRERGWRKRPTG